MLTTNTQIPTAVRGKVRAFIKAHSGFNAWMHANNLLSSNVSNSQLIEYAIMAGIDADIESIMQGGPVNNGYVRATPITQQDIIDNEAEDARIEALIAEVAVARGLGVVQEIVEEGARYPVADMSQVSALAVCHSLDAILAPVEPFLSPLVKAELNKALKPLIDAANKPATEKIVEVEKVVERFTVTNLSPLPVGATPYAVPSTKVSLGSLFGFKGQYAKTFVTTWDAHGAAPVPSPFYVVDPFNMFALATAAEMGENVWSYGPSGTGKSTLPEQFCAIVGRPCVKLGFTRQTEVADLIGGPAVMPDGSTQWQDGALIQAMKRPGMVIVLDELTIAPAGSQAIIQLVSDNHRSITLPTGEKVVAAHGVMFVVADNTNGTGDQTGQYHGTNASNQALVNRFGYMLEIDYMSKADESRAVVNHTGCPKPAADALADFVSRARKMPEMENMVLSLRQMVAFVKAVKNGWPAKQAATSAFLNRMPMAERAALETLLTLAWGNEFTNLMSGTAADKPAPVLGSPADDGVFDDEITAAMNRA